MPSQKTCWAVQLGPSAACTQLATWFGQRTHSVIIQWRQIIILLFRSAGWCWVYYVTVGLQCSQKNMLRSRASKTYSPRKRSHCHIKLFCTTYTTRVWTLTNSAHQLSAKWLGHQTNSVCRMSIRIEHRKPPTLVYTSDQLTDMKLALTTASKMQRNIFD